METIIEMYNNLPTPTNYIVVAIFVLFIISIILKLKSFFKKTSKILSGRKYRKNPEGSNLTPEQQTALNIGAINSEQTMYYCDSLKTGDSKENLAKNLADYYGIGTMMTPATEILNWLNDEGHRIYFDALKNYFVHLPKSEWQSKVKESFPKDIHEKCIEYLNNLDDCIPALIDRGFITDRNDIENISIMAWDMGRLVNITRGSYDCGFVYEKEAWTFINDALEKCRAVYKDWNELATGYVVGRAMWGGDTMMLSGIMGITEDLLKDKDSPWQELELR